jgi:hypothetical protein
MGHWTLNQLHDIEQESNGADLALARISLEPQFRFEPSDGVDYGTDVWTFGYPLTEAPSELNPSYVLHGRYIQGYVMRDFFYGAERRPSYELDMPAPAGLSGAPLVEIPSKRVVSIIYGRHSVESVEEFASVDTETGERTPEVLSLEHFALAHYHEVFWNLAGTATGGDSLKEHVSAALAASEQLP